MTSAKADAQAFRKSQQAEMDKIHKLQAHISAWDTSLAGVKGDKLPSSGGELLTALKKLFVESTVGHIEVAKLASLKDFKADSPAETLRVALRSLNTSLQGKYVTYQKAFASADDPEAMLKAVKDYAKASKKAMDDLIANKNVPITSFPAKVKKYYDLVAAKAK